jgi:hypothetical protein
MKRKIVISVTSVLFGYVWMLALLFLPSAASHAAGAWQVAKQDREHDVVVYTRKLDNGDSEFKGITHVKSSLSGCVALLRDVDAMPKWVDRTVMAKVLHWVSDIDVYAYNVTHMDVPFTDRDAIVHSVLQQDPDTLVVTIKGEGLQAYQGKTLYNYKSNEHSYVRMVKVESFWRFVPQDKGRVEVTFQGSGDPGGNISNPVFKWFIGFAIWTSPYETLKKCTISSAKVNIKTPRLRLSKNPTATIGVSHNDNRANAGAGCCGRKGSECFRSGLSLVESQLCREKGHF